MAASGKSMAGVARGKKKGTFDASGAVHGGSGKRLLGASVARNGEATARTDRVSDRVMGDGKGLAQSKSRNGDTSKPKKK